MKKTIVIAALVAAALAAAGVGAAFAQDVTPPYGGRGPMMQGGQAPMRTFIVTEFAKKLNLTVDDVNARLAAGETLRDIALSEGVSAEDFPALMREVRAKALDAAVKANVITQEQADWMKSHGFRRGGRGRCDGSGPRGGGWGMMGPGWGWQNQQPNP